MTKKVVLAIAAVTIAALSALAGSYGASVANGKKIAEMQQQLEEQEALIDHMKTSYEADIKGLSDQLDYLHATYVRTDAD